MTTQPVQLTIMVSDQLSSSLFTPILRVCNCLNGGSCQYDSVTENHQKGTFQVRFFFNSLQPFSLYSSPEGNQQCCSLFVPHRWWPACAPRDSVASSVAKSQTCVEASRVSEGCGAGGTPSPASSPVRGVPTTPSRREKRDTSALSTVRNAFCCPVYQVYSQKFHHLAMKLISFFPQTCAALLSPSPATKTPSASARGKTSPARVKRASLATDITAQVLSTHDFSVNDGTVRSQRFNGPLLIADIDECAELTTCGNAKFQCRNGPGSVACLCRYRRSKDTDGCGMCTHTLLLSYISALTGSRRFQMAQTKIFSFSVCDRCLQHPLDLRSLLFLRGT